MSAALLEEVSVVLEGRVVYRSGLLSAAAPLPGMSNSGACRPRRRLPLLQASWPRLLLMQKSHNHTCWDVIQHAVDLGFSNATASHLWMLYCFPWRTVVIPIMVEINLLTIRKWQNYSWMLLSGSSASLQTPELSTVRLNRAIERLCLLRRELLCSYRHFKVLCSLLCIWPRLSSCSLSMSWFYLNPGSHWWLLVMMDG